MITLERLAFTRESIVSVSIEKSVVLEERYRFYPEYTWKFLGFIKCRRENYLKDVNYTQESREYNKKIGPGKFIRLPDSRFCSSLINDGKIGEDQYPDGSYKVYRLPYIIIRYLKKGVGFDRSEYTFESEKDLNSFLKLLIERKILLKEDIFYDKALNKITKNIEDYDRTEKII